MNVSEHQQQQLRIQSHTASGHRDSILTWSLLPSCALLLPPPPANQFKLWFPTEENYSLPWERVACAQAKEEADKPKALQDGQTKLMGFLCRKEELTQCVQSISQEEGISLSPSSLLPVIGNQTNMDLWVGFALLLRKRVPDLLQGISVSALCSA